MAIAVKSKFRKFTSRFLSAKPVMEQKFFIFIFVIVIFGLFLIKEKIERNEFSEHKEPASKLDELKDLINIGLKQVHS